MPSKVKVLLSSTLFLPECLIGKEGVGEEEAEAMTRDPYMEREVLWREMVDFEGK